MARICGLVLMLATLVTCAPGPKDWRRVADVQRTAVQFQVGKLGILPFRCSNASVGDLVADTIAANLIDSSLVIVERTYLAEIVKEQGLSLTGLTETSDYSKIGHLADVDFLLVGSIGLQEGVSYRGFGRFASASAYSYVSNASARVIRVDTGQVIVSCSYLIPSGAGSEYWTDPGVVGKTIADAFQEELEKK